jgi:hypothetical protein
MVDRFCPVICLAKLKFHRLCKLQRKHSGMPEGAAIKDR